MAEDERTYLCIDLKTFYASVECADRGLDPFTTNLVVADPARGPSTICLAVTPAMKALGVRNRCRVFDIPPSIRYIKARPRMRHYMEVSAQIYGIYLEYVSPQDIHPYSIDECFIDATPYLKLYGIDARTFAERHRTEPLPREGRPRYHCQARKGRHRRAQRGDLSPKDLAAPSHHGYLGHRPWHRRAA